MKKFKVLAMMLLFWSMTAYATIVSPVDEKHPFLRIGIAPGNVASIYIGAYGILLPEKMNSGDAIIFAKIVADVDSPGHKKGQTKQYVILADCKLKIAKVLIYWEKPDEKSPGVPKYKLKGDKLQTKIEEELRKQEVQDVEPGSMLDIIVSSGCHYVGEEYIITKPKSNSPLY